MGIWEDWIYLQKRHQSHVEALWGPFTTYVPPISQQGRLIWMFHPHEGHFQVLEFTFLCQDRPLGIWEDWTYLRKRHQSHGEALWNPFTSYVPPKS